MKIKHIVVLLGLISISYGQENLEVYKQSVKTSCIQQSVYAGKTLEEQKKILIEQAKQESLEELYGTLIFSSSDISNGKLIKDEIKSRAVGGVRVKGNPEFYNGKNFGEVCADVTSYITKEDAEKYSVKEIQLKNFCYTDTSITIKDIKAKARENAFKEILIKFKPSLSSMPQEQIQQFIHGYEELNANFDFDKSSYCFDAVGSVMPYELEMSSSANNVPQQNNSNNQNAQKIDENLFIKFGVKQDKCPQIFNFLSSKGIANNSTIFAIESSNKELSPYLEEIKTALVNNQTCSIATNNFDSKDAFIRIKVSGNVNTKKQYGNFITSVNLGFEYIYQNSTIAKFNKKLESSSTIDFKDSKNKSIEAISSEIQNTGSLVYLGLIK